MVQQPIELPILIEVENLWGTRAGHACWRGAQRCGHNGRRARTKKQGLGRDTVFERFWNSHALLRVVIDGVRFGAVVIKVVRIDRN